MIRYCPHCGQPFDFHLEATVCPHCGGALILLPPPPQQAPAAAAAPVAEAPQEGPPPPPVAEPAPAALPPERQAPSLPVVAGERDARGPRKAGLAFYDGQRWQAHTTQTAGVPLDRVYTLQPFHDQLFARLIAGYVVVYADGQWSRVAVPNPSGLAREVVIALAAGEDAVWFGSASGLSRYGGSGWTVYTAQNSGFPPSGICNESLAVDRRGTVWYMPHKSAFTAAGLGSFTGGSWRVRTKEEGCPFTMVGTPLLPDQHDRVWFAAMRGVCYWAQSRFHTIGDDVCGALGDCVTGKALDPEGRLWVSTYGSGLVARLPDQLTVYRQSDGLPSDCLTAVEFDSAGDLWLGTTRGLWRFRGGDLAHGEAFAEVEGLPGPFVWRLRAAEGGLWAVCGGSTAAFDLRFSRAVGRLIVAGSRLVHRRPYP